MQNHRPSNDSHKFSETAALYGLHPLTALVIFLFDHMLSLLEVISFGWFAFFSLVCGALVIGPVSVIQRRAYGDDRLLAVSKGCIVGLLLAVPSPLGSYLTGMWGIASVIGRKPGPPKAEAIDTDGFVNEEK